jgi:alpha-N-arabinofuranosidase
MANLAQTVNVLQALILTEKDKMILTPTYHVFDLFKVHQDAKYLPIAFTSPDYVMGDKKIPALNVSASQDASGAIHISLVNLDPKNSIALSTVLEGINWKSVTGQIVTSAKITDINTFSDNNKIHIVKFDGAKKSENMLKVELPAKSVVVLELK